MAVKETQRKKNKKSIKQIRITLIRIILLFASFQAVFFFFFNLFCSKRHTKCFINSYCFILLNQTNNRFLRINLLIYSFDITIFKDFAFLLPMRISLTYTLISRLNSLCVFKNSSFVTLTLPGH